MSSESVETQEVSTVPVRWSSVDFTVHSQNAVQSKVNTEPMTGCIFPSCFVAVLCDVLMENGLFHILSRLRHKWPLTSWVLCTEPPPPPGERGMMTPDPSPCASVDKMNKNPEKLVFSLDSGDWDQDRTIGDSLTDRWTKPLPGLVSPFKLDWTGRVYTEPNLSHH